MYEVYEVSAIVICSHITKLKQIPINDKCTHINVTWNIKIQFKGRHI